MRSLLVALALVALAAPAGAQQKIGFIDSEAILQRLPEFRSAEAAVDNLAQSWQAEIETKTREIEAQEREFEARELLYTDEERERRAAEITANAQARDNLRRTYFGPEGQLFREQQQLLRPVQERVIAAVEVIAGEGDYDYVFDRAGDFVFLYTKPRFDLTELVLDELGVGVGSGVGSR